MSYNSHRGVLSKHRVGKGGTLGIEEVTITGTGRTWGATRILLGIGVDAVRTAGFLSGLGVDGRNGKRGRRRE